VQFACGGAPERFHLTHAAQLVLVLFRQRSNALRQPLQAIFIQP
jgi:hypothetical protein